MAKGTVYAHFLNVEFPHFLAIYGHNEKGLVWFEGTSPEWCKPYPGAENEHVYYNHNIFLVTEGSVQVENKHLPTSPHVFTQGEGLSVARMNSRYKLTTLEDNTCWICLTPKEEIIYNRALINLEAGQTLKVEPSSDTTHYLIASGKVKMNGKVKPQIHMSEVKAGVPLLIEALEDSYVIKIWK